MNRIIKLIILMSFPAIPIITYCHIINNVITKHSLAQIDAVNEHSKDSPCILSSIDGIANDSMGANQKYDYVYDSIYHNIYNQNTAKTTDNRPSKPDYRYERFKRLWQTLEISDNDTVYLFRKRFNSNGHFSRFIIMCTRKHSFLNDGSVTSVELSPLATSLLTERWNPDSLRESGRQFEQRAADIIGGSRLYTHATRIIIDNGMINIDTVSYGSWKSDRLYVRLYKKYIAEKTYDPYLGIYHELFNRYWEADTSAQRPTRRMAAIDKIDFKQVWQQLDIQPKDTVYASIFNGTDADGRNFRIALFQSRKMTFWAYNPLPDTNNNADRDDNLLVLESPTRMPGGMDGPRPYKRYGEAWEKGYYDRYTATPLSERQRLRMERPQFGKGDNRCRVTNARVIINGDKHRIDTMSYTADLSVSPRMFLSCE